MDEDSLCGLIEGGIMPGSGQQLADTLTALPDFADSLEKWLKRLGEWMGERGLDAALAAQVTEMGGIIFPPVPAFYAAPKSIDDLVAHSVARVLDLFGVHTAKLKRWQGLKGTPADRD